jgi:exonuclease III
MAIFLRLALWNANGLTQHAEELNTFIPLHNIDIMLISETHFTEKNYFKLFNDTVYHTNHPAGTARGGSAIIIKKTPYSTIILTATTMTSFKQLLCRWKTQSVP